jgi:P pilus assembly chaperone PapD
MKALHMYSLGKTACRFPIPGNIQFVLLLCGIALLPVFGHSDLMAQGNLLITPRRVVFEGNRRNQELNLANTGSDTATYNVSLVEYRMKDDGSFEEIQQPDPGQNFADKYIRFFPRTVTLAPNEAQVVKMQLYKTNEMLPGEYRSHVYFRAVPKQKALGEEDKPKDSTSLSVKLTPIFGITIPVIIRVGEVSAKVTISDLSFQMVNDTLPRLSLTFNRSGNMSVYGDVTVNHISPNGKSVQVGAVRGISVYTPNLIRRAKMDLNLVPGINFGSGKLQVIYTGQSDTNPVKYAETELVLH